MDGFNDNNEGLFRAVRPDDCYWKDEEKTQLSSAAFKDPKGLSVDRQADRMVEEAIERQKKNFKGTIVSVTVGLCNEKQIVIEYCPTKDNEFHCELIQSKDKKLLSRSQARYLATNAQIYK